VTGSDLTSLIGAAGGAGGAGGLIGAGGISMFRITGGVGGAGGGATCFFCWPKARAPENIARAMNMLFFINLIFYRMLRFVYSIKNI
jgi:hypothetical protein